ncbi:N-succinylarginine dihydrolase [Sphingomonas sp. MMS24-JH45]
MATTRMVHALAQLRVAFAHPAFAVSPPVPPPFGDEGAANHMRLCRAWRGGGRGVRLRRRGRPLPPRQHRDASAAIARAHGLDPARTLFVRQSDAAIAAGAFHNDVVAVANERVLLAHEQAFADRDGFHADLRRLLPEVEIVEVPAAEVSLADAIGSYLFNAQLVTAGGETVLVVPGEARANAAVWSWIERHLAGNGPIRRVEVVDVRKSMANGGGPACLRMRVVCDPRRSIRASWSTAPSSTASPPWSRRIGRVDRCRRDRRRAVGGADRSGAGGAAGGAGPVG